MKPRFFDRSKVEAFFLRSPILTVGVAYVKREMGKELEETAKGLSAGRQIPGLTVEDFIGVMARMQALKLFEERCLAVWREIGGEEGEEGIAFSLVEREVMDGRFFA